MPVFDPMSLNRVLTPTQRRFDGLVLPIPTFPVVTSDIPPVLLKFNTLAVVPPYLTTWSRVADTSIDVIFVILPEESTVIRGISIPVP